MVTLTQLVDSSTDEERWTNVFSALCVYEGLDQYLKYNYIETLPKNKCNTINTYAMSNYVNISMKYMYICIQLEHLSTLSKRLIKHLCCSSKLEYVLNEYISIAYSSI